MIARTHFIAFAFLFGLAGVAPAQDAAKETPKADPAPAAETTPTPKAGDSEKAKPKDKDATTPAKPKTELATFGGGCFWCQEAVFERMAGVKSVVSGYSGGSIPNPSYQMVCTGETGHAEVIQIEYDPSVVPFEKLLNLFWAAHDPTTMNSQGPDFGTQYRSIILYHSPEQKKAAQASYKEMTASKHFRSPIVTELVPFVAFYPAEPYHQDYYRNHKFEDYSQSVIAPKLKKLSQKAKASK